MINPAIPGVVLYLFAAALVSPASAQTPAPQPQNAAPLPVITQKWTDDFDGMVKRRVIRALVVHSRTLYFVERGVQRGAAYEALKAFEDQINLKLKTGKTKVHVVFIPTTRDDIIPALLDGRADVAAASLTMTPERQKQVDFSLPVYRRVSEVVVTGPQSPPLATLDDLAGKDVFVRKSSSYWEHLEQLNERFKQAGKPPLKLKAAPESLENDDLLEMLNAGLFGITVVDDYVADLWQKVLKDIRVHKDIAISTGGDIGWMFRKNSPKLKAEVDAFVKTHGQGTLFGNTVIRRYLGTTQFVKNATSTEEIKKFQKVVELFRRYGTQYNLDYLLMMAQGYQESRLDHGVKSKVGAVGVMQVMPSTGMELKVGDVSQLEPNIHAGVKYLRFAIDQHYAKEPMDRLNKGLFAFASYNAGPARIQQLRKEAASRGLNPNVWFNNVEMVAAERIGAETVTYVSNIFKYYIAYKLLTEEEEERRKAREAVKKSLQ